MPKTLFIFGGLPTWLKRWFFKAPETAVPSGDARFGPIGENAFGAGNAVPAVEKPGSSGLRIIS